jgi:hypothetical protein
LGHRPRALEDRRTRNRSFPLVERLIEIDLDEYEGAAIKIRPRNVAATVNLRAFEEIGLQGVSLAYDSARRVMQALTTDEA